MKKQKRVRTHWKQRCKELELELANARTALHYSQYRQQKLADSLMRRLSERLSRPALYLAGPMSGVPQHNKPFFNQLARQLEEDCDFRVLNPAGTDGGSTDKSRSFYLGRALELVKQSAGIVCMSDWYDSPGAKLEVQMATQLGKPVFVLKDDKWWETRDRVVKE